MPVDISRKGFGNTNLRGTWSARRLVNIRRGGNEDVGIDMGGAELVGFREQT